MTNPLRQISTTDSLRALSPLRCAYYRAWRRRWFGVLVIVFLALWKPWAGDGYDPMLYYAQLTSAFFDGDQDFANDLAEGTNTFGVTRQLQWTVGPRGYTENPFAVGTALTWLPAWGGVWFAGQVVGPWFAPEWAATWAGDRFAAPYRWAVSLTTWFCFVAGLMLMARLARRVASREGAAAAVVVCGFASPLLAYATRQTAFSHVASMLTVALLLEMCFRARKFRSTAAFVAVGGAWALVALVRWQDAVWAAVPVAFFVSQQALPAIPAARRGLARRVALGAGFAVMLLLIQSAAWFPVYGALFTMPQGPGFMRWGDPQIGPVLFSGWNGLLYWHPLLALGFVGLGVMAWRRGLDFVSVALVGTALLSIYVNACVADWFGGNAFGARRFCSVLPVLAMGVACAWDALVRRRPWRGVARAVLVVGVLLNVAMMAMWRRGALKPFFLEEWIGAPVEAGKQLLIGLTTAFLDGGTLGSRVIPMGPFANMIPGSREEILGYIAAAVLTTAAALWFPWPSLARVLHRNWRGVVAILLAFAAMATAGFAAMYEPPDVPATKFRALISGPWVRPNFLQQEKLRDLARQGSPNPAILAFTLYGAPDDAWLTCSLTAFRRHSPRMWARWIREQDDESIHAIYGDEAARLSPTVEPDLVEVALRGAASLRRMRGSGVEIVQLAVLRLLNPGHYAATARWFQLQRTATPPPPDLAAQEARYLAWQRARWQTYLRHARTVGDFNRTLYVTQFRDAQHALEDDAWRRGDWPALAGLYAEIYEAGQQDRTVRPARVAAVAASDGDTTRALRALRNQTTLWPRTYINVARGFASRGDLSTARQVLQLGFERYEAYPDLVETYHELTPNDALTTQSTSRLDAALPAAISTTP